MIYEVTDSHVAAAGDSASNSEQAADETVAAEGSRFEPEDHAFEMWQREKERARCWCIGKRLQHAIASGTESRGRGIRQAQYSSAVLLDTCGAGALSPEC